MLCAFRERVCTQNLLLRSIISALIALIARKTPASRIYLFKHSLGNSECYRAGGYEGGMDAVLRFGMAESRSKWPGYSRVQIDVETIV